MTRIIYGVHGTGHGHAIRALAVARMFPEHEFIFVSHGTGLDLLGREHRVIECRGPETIISAHRVAAFPTLKQLTRFVYERGSLLRHVRTEFDRFQPDVAITDYEHYVPLAARESGVPCLSLDHQHILPLCGAQIPCFRYPDYLITLCSLRILFSTADYYLVTSFFTPPRTANTLILPPLLRPAVLDRTPSNGEHVLAYQGYSTFPGFLPFLRTIRHPVIAYGFNRNERVGNVLFKQSDEDDFLDDLAGCRYVVCGGGHTVMSEALYYGKPVLSFPIRHAIEQYLNAWHVRHLGYGDMLQTENPPAERLVDFENRLDSFRGKIRCGLFHGNDRIATALQTFIERGANPQTPHGPDTAPLPARPDCLEGKLP